MISVGQVIESGVSFRKDKISSKGDIAVRQVFIIFLVVISILVIFLLFPDIAFIFFKGIATFVRFTWSLVTSVISFLKK